MTQSIVMPDWMLKVNNEAKVFELDAILPLDENSVVKAARDASGLSDFGDDNWHQALQVLLHALQHEAELTLMGRLMARNDIHHWLCNRLLIEECYRCNPEIDEQEINEPMFIVGLPRSGTSILFELLAQDPNVGAPLMWEAMLPCPPPEEKNYHSDSRIAKADAIFTQWNRAMPAFASMHEMSGTVPAECGLIMANTFISDHIASLHQTPSYNEFFLSADKAPVYAYHKKVLKLLQWKNPRQRWLLKAPEHQVNLTTLLSVYPDARIVQTHRDPIKCMASASSLMEALYKIRSNKAFDTQMFENILLGSATAERLNNVIRLREQGHITKQNITDSRYQDLMDKPIDCIDSIYQHFGLTLSQATRSQMLGYLENKPKGKFGAHQYQVDTQVAAKERPLFSQYQEHYDVPSEV